MTQHPDSLHAALLVAVTYRLNVAAAASSGTPSGGHWRWACDTPVQVTTDVVDALHISLHDPAAVIRHCEADLRRLGRHKPCRRCGQLTHPWACHHCGGRWPCHDVRDLAAAYDAVWEVADDA
jgi:hypothetical protein